MRAIALPLLTVLGCGHSGEGEPGETTDSTAMDRDGDGWPEGEDCDDQASWINPGATETCDEEDDDCNGVVDDIGSNSAADGAILIYKDEDGDGWGSGDARWACIPIWYSYSKVDGDCDETDRFVHPAQSECPGNGVDDDCDGSIDEDTSTTEVAPSCGIWRIEGGQNYGVGAALAGGWDVDGADGPDLVVGSSDAAWFLTYQGERRQELSRETVPHTSSDTTLAYGLTGMVQGGDLDGDGVEDLGLLSWNRPTEDYWSGGAWILSGPLTPDDVLDDGTYLLGEDSEALGWAALMGPIDEVEGDDLVVGGPHPYGEPAAGKVWILSGPRAPGVVDLAETLTLYGGFDDEGEGDQAGAALATVDLDGDGVATLIVGAPTAATTAYSSTYTEGGHVYLVDPPFADGELLEDADYLWGPKATKIGAGLLATGDLDGDGLDDLLVDQGGAPREIWLVGSSAGVHPIGDVAFARVELPVDEVYQTSRAAGDLDGDGAVDLVLGLGVAGAWIYRGPFEGVSDAEDVAVTVAPSSADWWFVAFTLRSLLVTPDLTGNGQAELVIGVSGAVASAWSPPPDGSGGPVDYEYVSVLDGAQLFGDP